MLLLFHHILRNRRALGYRQEELGGVSQGTLPMPCLMPPALFTKQIYPSVERQLGMATYHSYEPLEAEPLQSVGSPHQPHRVASVA